MPLPSQIDTSTFTHNPATLALDTQTITHDIDLNGTTELTRTLDRRQTASRLTPKNLPFNG